MAGRRAQERIPAWLEVVTIKRTLRLDKLLAHAGFGTRSEIKLIVKRGAVAVNGRTVKDSGQQVDPQQDEVTVDGEPVDFREHIYVMLNKPPGVVSATEDVRDRTVVDVLGAAYAHAGLFPVGRLDKDTEGLLLLTNDGKLAHRLLAPKKHVPKTYYARVAGTVLPEHVALFAQGVTLDDGYVTMPARLVILDEAIDPFQDEADAELAHIELTIMEGKFHQVKRMFQVVGGKVVYLKRIAMGPLVLDERLAPGQFRELTDAELDALKGGN